MTPLFKKLNWKHQAEIVVINSPERFETELAAQTMTRDSRRAISQQGKARLKAE
jgi:hypothetical protein